MDWVRTFRADRLKADISASVTTWAVVIPQALAYATIAGLPVQVGLYTAVVPPLVYAWSAHRGRYLSARRPRSRR
jgi:sulfate permease, SulP family